MSAPQPIASWGTSESRPAELRSLRPERREALDLLFAVVVTGIAVVGFDATFGGNEAYTVGLPAVVCGAAVGFVIARLRPQVLVAAAGAVLAFFALGGGVALRQDATAGIISGPHVWSGLVDGIINGWVRLLTTVPPAGHAGHLLAIPYLAGFAGGLLTVVAALLVRRLPLCIVPPSIVLGVAVLFSVDKPGSLPLVQGALFGGATITWLCLRVDRTTRPVVSHGSRSRILSGVALVAVSVLGATHVAHRLPYAEANQRYVLRDKVKPPFDPSQYPSPLARYRRFDGQKPPTGPELTGTLLTEEGLPKGVPVRFAVMDAYDGFVWRASSPCSCYTGTYRRVGDHIAGAQDGDSYTAHFTMGDLAASDSVWIPTFGSPTAISFSGADGKGLTEAFRFNRAVEAAASPKPLAKGDTWTVTANVPTPDKALQKAGYVSEPLDQSAYALTDKIKARVDTWVKGRSTPYGRVQGIRSGLYAIGAYNNGDPAHPVPPGHGRARLIEFLESPQPQGNDEQFAAAVAFLANAEGIPARVVIEFTPHRSDGPVAIRANDTHAVVEIEVQGGWLTIGDLTPPTKPNDQVRQQQEVPKTDVQPPPPTTVPPPSGAPEESDVDQQTTKHVKAPHGRPAVIGAFVLLVKVVSVPLILLVGPAVLIIFLKARRRGRRRSQGPPATRVAAAWSEVADLARDLGHPVPPKATRLEVARFAALPGVDKLAAEVDSSIFGHAEPDDGAASRVWTAVDQVRRRALGERRPIERIQALVSLSSLRGIR